MQIDRRVFVASVAAGMATWVGRAALARAKSAGVNLATGTAETETGAAAQGPGKLTLAVETSTFHRHKAPGVFALIREAGVRYVELSDPHFPTTRASPTEVRELQRQLGDAGLTAAAAFVVHGISSADEAARHKAVENWKRSTDAVQQFGLKFITTELTGDKARPVECEQAFRKSLDELLPIWEQARVRVSVEPHPGDFFEAADPTIKLLAGYRSPHLSYLHCTAHTFFLGETRAVIGQAGSLLTHLHLADSFRPERISMRSGVGVHLHLRPSLGDVDFRDVFDALGSIGYSGYVSLQLFSHADKPAEACRVAREYLQDLLKDRLAT